ncbi:helix-turn-helix domain-containing protein [Ensifer sp. ENS05]|uniref:IclR family transcriptional regulator n=1 Tax=Ensifer sp. ENS05 TaxID=2769277 RepID=UPI00178134D1|nr:IclR family transcriptional regulator C-terminal domain-containing protein [Ensifer sp. ENS05]MBD9596385.1 helix-turn-helix domain-containing protein [Ensifer sp. ENS05]
MASDMESMGLADAEKNDSRSSGSKMLDALDLFSVERPVISAPEIAADLGLTRATAYRYLKTLCEAGLLLRLGNSDFCLGPRIVQLDRQIQLSDPLIAAGRPAMGECLRDFRWDALLLCNLARDIVLCIHQEVRPDSEIRLKRARGMPFPLFQGPASLVILAHLPMGRMRDLYIKAFEERDAFATQMGADWAAVRKRLKSIKKDGFAMSSNEFHTGLIGIAAPILDAGGRVFGSVAAVAPQASSEQLDRTEMIESVKSCARSIEQKLDGLSWNRKT